MFAQAESYLSSSRRLPHVVSRVALLFLLLTLCSGALAGQDEKEIPALEAGKPIQRELGGGQFHSYRVELAAGQFLHITVEQRGIDVVVKLFSTDNRKVLEVDSPNDKYGPESVSLIAETPGRYRIEIYPLNQKAAGRYEIRMESLREATAKDKLRLTAEKTFAEAQQLARQATSVELLGRASEKLEESLSLWRQLEEKYWEAFTLATLANVRRAQEQPQQSLSLLTQALSIYAALGDRRNEAATLVNLAALHNALQQTSEALDELTRALKIIRALEDRASEASTLYTIAITHFARGDAPAALSFFNEALPLWRKLNERLMEAYTYNYLGLVYSATWKLTEALEQQNQALKLMRELQNRAGEAQTLSYIGAIYRSQGETTKALENYNQALAYRRSVSDLAGQALSLFDIAATYDYAGEDRKAIQPYTEALALYRQLKDQRAEAAVLYALGTVYDELGEKPKALEVLNQALTLRRSLNETANTANTLYYIGTVHNDLNDSPKAIEFLNQALPLHRAAGDRAGEARTLNYLGDVYLLDDNEQALKHYQQALAIRRGIKDQRGEADTLNNLALLYAATSKTQEALDHLTQALTLARATKNVRGEAQALNGFGIVYSSLGELPKALKYQEQALELWRAAGDGEGQAQSLSLISNVHALMGENRKALESNEQAAPIIRALGDGSAETVNLYNTGMMHLSAEEYRKAIDAFNRAMSLIRSAGQERAFAHLPVLTAVAHYLLDENEKALELYTSALPQLQANGNRSLEALAHVGIALVESDRGNLLAARTRAEAALKIIESLRTGVASQALRISFFASSQEYFEFYIDVLMRLHKQQPRAGHDGEAFEASELGRARSFLESLNEAKADIRQGVDPALVEREKSLRLRLNASAEQQQLTTFGGPDAAKQAQAVADEIESLTSELQRVEAEIRQKSPAYAALTQPQPLTLKEIQAQVLDEDTLLLEYSLGGESSFLWAVTPTGVASYELPKRELIDAAARKVYELLNARNETVKGETSAGRERRIMAADAEYPAAAARLSQMVLAPAAEQLGNKRLLIVAQGTLQYIPFGALPDPTADSAAYTPLLVGHESVTLLSASTLALLRRETRNRPLAPKAVAVLADPVFSATDQRLQKPSGVAQQQTAPQSTSQTSPATRRIEHEEVQVNNSSAAVKSVLRIKRLPYTRQEADEILKLAPAAESIRALDFAANRQFVNDPQLSRYRYVHFATHGFIDSDHPELSGIVLSMVDDKGAPQNGFLRAHEIFNLKLPAELVVLSACQTGLGKEVRGEGLVGMTRAFMYAGAPRVVVSLWSVSDRATAELMARFYRGMLKEKLRPAAALRAAQLSLMKERGWESPFYWAAFTLQGEWR